MATRIGRVTLTTPLAVPFDRKNAEAPGVAGPFYEKGFAISGRETGASAQTTATALEKESQRFHSMWCESDEAAFPSGHYRIEKDGYEKPGGAPGRRPWQLAIVKKLKPVIVRQGEDDIVAASGVTSVADPTADEAAYALVPTSASGLDALKSQTSGAEKLNLPAGQWKTIARVQSKTTVGQQYAWKLFTPADVLIQAGSNVTVGAGNNDVWLEIDLGILTIPNANDQSNYYVVVATMPGGSVNPVWIDRIRFVPVN